MTEIGDLICPHCRSTLRAPMFCEFHAGWRRCVICARPIRITYETARKRAALRDWWKLKDDWALFARLCRF